jgi:cell division topological specificity factor
MFGFGRKRSKDKLKERLKLVLSYDRAGLTPGKMEELKTELLQVIQKYFPANETDYDVKLEQQGDRMIFVANLPVSKN